MQCVQHCFNGVSKMFVDIVRSGNEKQLVSMAERLGIKAIAIYSERSHDLSALQSQTAVKLFCAGPKSSNLHISHYGKGNGRLMIGINQLLKHSEYKSLAEQQSVICFPLADILRHPHQLENIIRHIKLCRKYKVQIAAATFASSPYEMRPWQDLKSLMLHLGMSTSQAASSLEAVWTLVKP